MSGRPEALGFLARRLGVSVLIFALLVQGMALAFASGRLGAAASGDLSWAGFELCSHNGSPAQSGDGTNSPVTSEHCIFCLSGASLAALPFPAGTFIAALYAIVPWQFTVWHLPPGPVNASAQPRGPPFAV